MVGILCLKKHLLPLNCKKNIYFALVYSNLIYCIEVYANVNKSCLHSLSVKCNRLLRVLQNKPRRTRLYDWFSNFDTLPIDLLFQLYTMKLMHRCLFDSSNIPKPISNLFTRCSDVHSHNTRSKANFAIQMQFNPKSIAFYGPSMWSKLPTNFRNNASLTSFSKQYKASLLNSIL